MSLQGEIQQLDNGNFMTRLSLAFITASSFDFKSYQPSTLPLTSQSVDVWLLRDQTVLITKNSRTEDSMVNMFFPGFTNAMRETFGQTVVPTQKPFNQGLVLEAGRFKFVNMNTSTIYEVQNTVDMSQAYRTFSQLISQDQKFQNQLQSFVSMLINSRVFEPPSTLAPKRRRSVRTSQSVNSSDSIQNLVFPRVHAYNLNTTTGRIRNKRNIADIFSPYSVQSIGDTAGQNYAKMNLNFDQIHHTEERLSHQQTVLAEMFSSLNVDQKRTKRKELYLELRAFRTSYFQNFMFDLQDILKHNTLDPVYDILFELLREHEFCYSATCYTLPIFSVLNATTLQVSVQTAEQSLAPAVYVSCTIMPNLRTSIFSHQIALLDGNILNFQADQLPSIPLEDLIHPKVDQATRQLQLSDYVHQQLYLIYSGKRISLQCITAQMITVNKVKRYCDQTTLNFIPFPESISIGKETVLKVAIPHHFSSKLDFLNNDMRSLSTFQQTNFTDPHFGHQVINFFQTAEAIHYSFTFIVFVCIILLSTLFCCCCYLKCPSFLLEFALCCYANTCCLKKRVLQRHEEQGRKDTELGPMSSGSGYQPVHNPSQSPQPHQPIHNPSQPPQPQPRSVEPSAPTFRQPQIQIQPEHYTCPQSILSCHCLENGSPCVWIPPN